MTKLIENHSKTILFSILDKTANEFGMITESRNLATAERIFNQFIKDSKLNPEEFELRHVANITRITYENPEDGEIVKQKLHITNLITEVK